MVTGIRNLSVRAEVGAPRQRERRSPAGRTGGGTTWAPGSPLGRRQEAVSSCLTGRTWEDLGALSPPAAGQTRTLNRAKGWGLRGFQQYSLLEAEGREAASK